MKHRVAWGWVGALISSVLLFGLCSRSPAQEQDPEHPIWTYKDSWFLPPPPRLSRETEAEQARWKSIRGADIIPITGPMASKAETRLAKVAVAKLTLAEAEALAGKRLSPRPGKSPYLLRSVYLNDANGGFTVSYRDDLVVVSYDCLGRHPLPMQRRPLIVFLPRTPTAVFVTCSMAE